MMLYKLIQNHNPQVVVDKVNEELEKGWRPQGGISISAVGDDRVATYTMYAQALIKD